MNKEHTMLDWIYQWLWPTVEAAAVFGGKPLALGIDAASVDVLAARFPGRVLSLVDCTEEAAKQALIGHVIGQMTERGGAPKALLILRQPQTTSAQIHLRRLLDHRSVSQTWVALVDATEPVDVTIQRGCYDGKMIV